MSTLRDTLAAHRNRKAEPITEDTATPEPRAQGKSGAGKSNWSRNPDNATWMFYVDKKQKQQALRKWEDEHPETPEASDMLAFLLGRFLAG